MLAAIHQPAYLPWRPYLDKIAQADIFILLDTVPFAKGEVVNRNHIVTRDGELLLLTIPVVHDHRQPLSETRIDEQRDWRFKHLESIRMAYARAPAFEQIYPALSERYEHQLLSELCLDQLDLWLRLIGSDTPIVRASQLAESGTATARLISLCRAVGADGYLSGAGGRDYLDADALARAGIELVYQEHARPLVPRAALHDLMHAGGAA